MERVSILKPCRGTFRRAAPSRIPEELDKLAPDKKQLLKESPEK